MTYIISPAFVYMLGVCDHLQGLGMVALAILTISMAASGIVAGVSYLANISYGDDDKDVQTAKRIFKFLRRGIIPLIILAILVGLIPSKETLIEMQIAKYATFENAESAMTMLKNATDYVIDAIKSLG